MNPFEEWFNLTTRLLWAASIDMLRRHVGAFAPDTPEVEMDNENRHEEGHVHEGSTPSGDSRPAEPAPVDVAAVIEQVRELLFGDHRRTTEGSMKAMEDRLAALTATLESRFADIERRFAEIKSEAGQTRDSEVESLGAAFAELGEKIKSFVAKSPRPGAAPDHPHNDEAQGERHSLN